ncbi:hypothetical protein [Streptomyces sp. NPDC093149]|uniref:hypothetical protein n=1 Tax=Streptomyces sp. NPDC093149 TaxID=3366031 RepID=UPI0038158406
MERVRSLGFVLVVVRVGGDVLGRQVPAGPPGGFVDIEWFQLNFRETHTLSDG